MRYSLWLFFCICLVASPTSVNRDPDSILTKHKARFEFLKSTQDFVQGMENISQQVAPELGMTGAMASFLSTLSGGGYTKQLQQIMEIPVQRWNIAGMGYYEIENVKRTVTRLEHVNAHEQMSGKIGKVCNVLTALSVLNDSIKAIQGDDQAALSALGNTAKWVQGELVSEYGGKNLGIAMLGVAIIDYALTKFINFAFNSHQEYWWKGYQAYLNEKYPSPLEWAQLAERGGMEAVEKRLEEFWDNAETNASIYFLNGRRPPPHWGQVAGVHLVKFKREFAATYYKDYIHATVKTYFSTRAEQARIEMELLFDRMAKELDELVRDYELLKKAIENIPLDEEPDEDSAQPDHVTGLIDELQSISDRVVGFNRYQGNIAQCVASLQSCETRIVEMSLKLDGLGNSLQSWQSEVDRLDQTGPDLSVVIPQMQAQADRVARAKDAAGTNSLKACEETLNLKWNFSAAEKQRKLPIIRSAASRSGAEAGVAERTWAAMKARLDSLSGSGVDASELESRRVQMLGQIPDSAACDAAISNSTSELSVMEAELQTLKALEGRADQIVAQVQELLNSEPQEQPSIRNRLTRMKNKATWLVYKNKVRTLQGTIKAQLQGHSAKLASLRASLDKVNSSLQAFQSKRDGIRNALQNPVEGSGSDPRLLDLKSWVDGAELFVVPARRAADQAEQCRIEAERLQDPNQVGGPNTGTASNQGGTNTGTQSGSSTGTSVGANSATGTSSNATNGGSQSNANPWDTAANAGGDAWDQAAQDGQASSSQVGGNSNPVSSNTSRDEANQWIQAAKSEANPPSCNYQLALQYLGKARGADPTHPELINLETRIMKLRNDQLTALRHLGMANSLVQAGKLDDALREANLAAQRGSWCERNMAQDLIAGIQTEKTRTSVAAQRQRNTDMARSLVSTLTTIQNTLINQQNNGGRGGNSGGTSSNSGGSNATGTGSSQGGPYCSITIKSTPKGQTWALFKQDTGNNAVNYYLFQVYVDPEDPDAPSAQEMARRMTQAMRGQGRMDFLGEGSKASMMRRLEQLCPNPVSRQSY